MINLQNTFRSMLEKETSTDFVIKVGDEVIKAHRCVLAQNSEVFQKMFEQNGMTEVLNGDVIISDYTPECVRAMLEFFLYWRTILGSHVDDIFAISDKYKVELLKYECELIMANLIDSENIVKYCRIINLYDAPTLEKACANFIRIYNETFLKSKEWEEIKNNYPQLALQFTEKVIADLNKQK
uniref:BTB domain-containing protein n=1 Tax=Meloidogyne hapla TaxID=6305 RepID=A0A1I8BVD2_MELHA